MKRGGSAWFIALSLVATTASAQELGRRGGVAPIQENGRFSIVVENDLFDLGIGTPTDRFYSNGIFLAAEWSSPVLDKLTKWLAIGSFVPAEHRAYVGIGFSHELHTPMTINPCAAKYNDPLRTAQTDPVNCPREDQNWATNYAPRDYPFSAVWSVFLTAQRYFHREVKNGAFTQFHVWGRTDVGGWGRGAGLGYAVQKNWHGFFNDAFVTEGDSLATTPTGWLAQGPNAPVNTLVQVSAGGDMSLLRWAHGYIDHRIFPGVELDSRVHAIAITPRNQLGAGLTLRAGLLPEHSAEPMRPPGQLQVWTLYVEASADASAVFTDATYGDLDRYRHFLDEYTIGCHLKIVGVELAASLNWERQLFIGPLEKYPSNEVVTDPYHRYGHVGALFTF